MLGRLSRLLSCVRPLKSIFKTECVSKQTLHCRKCIRKYLQHWQNNDILKAFSIFMTVL